MRTGRKHGKRMLKQAGRHQFSHKKRGGGPEGIWCPICAHKIWGKMNKQDAQDKAAIRHMEGLE